MRSHCNPIRRSTVRRGLKNDQGGDGEDIDNGRTVEEGVTHEIRDCEDGPQTGT